MFLWVPRMLWGAIKSLGVGEHQKLSVRPLLDVQMDCMNEGRETAVYLVNKGLGPALVKDYTLLLDGKPMQQVLASKDSHLPFIGECKYNPSSPSVIAVNERHKLLTISFDEEINKLSWSNYMTFFSRIDLTVKYQSLYEEKKPVLLQKNLGTK